MQFAVAEWKRNVGNSQVDLHTPHSPSHCCGIQLLLSPLLCGEYLSLSWFTNTKEQVGNTGNKNTQCIVHAEPSTQHGRCISGQAWAVGFLRVALPTVLFENQELHGMFDKTRPWLIKERRRLEKRLIRIRCGGPAEWAVPSVTCPGI